MFSQVSRQSHLQNESDEQLLIKYQIDKHPACANELYARYIHLIYGAAMKYLRHQEKSRELSLQIFQKLLELKNAKDVKSLNYWIYAMVRNECISKNRKQAVEDQREDSFQYHEANEESFMENEGYVRLMNDEPEKESSPILKYIQKLPKEQKECVELFYFKELSYKAIEQKTGYELKQVKSFIQNGKRNLKIMLEKSLSE